MRNKCYLAFSVENKTDKDSLELHRDVRITSSLDDLQDRAAQSEKSPTDPTEEMRLGKNIGFGGLQKAHFDQMLAFLDVFPMGGMAIDFGRYLLTREFKGEVEKGYEKISQEIDGWEVFCFDQSDAEPLLRRFKTLKRQQESFWVFQIYFLWGWLANSTIFLLQLCVKLLSTSHTLSLGHKRIFLQRKSSCTQMLKHFERQS